MRMATLRDHGCLQAGFVKDGFQAFFFEFLPFCVCDQLQLVFRAEFANLNVGKLHTTRSKFQRNPLICAD